MPACYSDLDSRPVAVTGGASGIGAAIVDAFAAQGARVGILDVDTDAAETLVVEIEQRGDPKPLFRRCDLTDTDALGSTFAALADDLGPLRVLVNNAGNDDRHNPDSIDAAYWRDRLAVNLDHQFFAAQAVAPGMKAAGGGAIVNMGSIAWVLGMADLPAYATAKAGIVGLTKSLARAWGGDGIRVNCINAPRHPDGASSAGSGSRPTTRTRSWPGKKPQAHLLPDRGRRAGRVPASDSPRRSNRTEQ